MKELAKVLAVPNWSAVGLSLPDPFDLAVHYHQGDPDHQRTVTAYSGLAGEVEAATLALAAAWLPQLDLRTQHGVHPRIGALDVCPFVGEIVVPTVAQRFWREFGIPVTLYEKSAPGRSLPDVRRGLYPPDFGSAPHPQWGVTVMGQRDFLIALNVNLPTTDLTIARSVARQIRLNREAGVPNFSGVRALAFSLDSQQMTQISMNITRPDEVSIDELVGWIRNQLPVSGATELIGVIRRRDLATATVLEVQDSQVVD
jgi:glutamate formiminotransferase